MTRLRRQRWLIGNKGRAERHSYGNWGVDDNVLNSGPAADYAFNIAWTVWRLLMQLSARLERPGRATMNWIPSFFKPMSFAHAVMQGNEPAVRKHLQAGMGPTAKLLGEEGVYPFHFAVCGRRRYSHATSRTRCKYQHMGLTWWPHSSPRCSFARHGSCCTRPDLI